MSPSVITLNPGLDALKSILEFLSFPGPGNKYLLIPLKLSGVRGNFGVTNNYLRPYFGFTY